MEWRTGGETSLLFSFLLVQHVNGSAGAPVTRFFFPQPEETHGPKRLLVFVKIQTVGALEHKDVTSDNAHGVRPSWETHSDTSHKPRHDVRRQLCTQSGVFLSAAFRPCVQTESTIMHEGTREEPEAPRTSARLCSPSPASQFNETMWSNRTPCNVMREYIYI